MVPDKDGAADVVFLGAGRTALALFDSKGLLDFPMILLNLPADGTQAMRIVSRILRKVVGHDPFRAVFIDHDPEQFKFLVARESMDFDEFPMPAVVVAPFQVADGFVFVFAAAVIDFPVAF